MANISLFNLSIDGFKEKPAVLSFELLEGTYGDDSLSVSFMANSNSLSESVIGKEANFSFEFNGKKEFFNGIVAGCSAEQAAELSRVTLNIKTIRHLLDKEKKYSVHCESDAEAIIKSVLRKAGISSYKCSLGKYYHIDFKIQYDESDLNFLQRLLEDLSIIEFVKHSEGRSELFIGDKEDFSASALTLTKCRLEITDSGNFFFGYGHIPLRPGTALNAFGETFIVCSALHSGSQEAAFGLKDKKDGYTCQIAAFSKRTLRKLPRSKEKPKIPGIIVAKTEGFIGTYASIDSKGRYIVRMPFDSENPGMTCSIPVHLAQSFAGIGYGVHFPLRAGIPVLIAFENGDIDKPIALGAIPRGLHTGPVIGANSFQNILKTASGTKLTFDDAANGFGMEVPKNILVKAKKGLLLEGEDKSILKTKKGTMLNMDEKKGSILVKTKQTKLNLNDKNKSINMDAPDIIAIKTGNTRLGLGDDGKSINMGAGKNVSINAKEKLLLKGKRQTAIQTEKGIKIVLDDSKGSLKIEAPMNITIKAGGRLVLKGKMIEIN